MRDGPAVSVQLDSPVAVYRQIVDQIRTYCVDGALKPGHALPSVRQLAFALGVHFNTVAEAYRLLAEEGWVDIKQGRGVRVRERHEPLPPTDQELQQQGWRLRHLIAELRSHGLGERWIREQVEKALVREAL